MIEIYLLINIYMFRFSNVAKIIRGKYFSQNLQTPVGYFMHSFKLTNDYIYYSTKVPDNRWGQMVGSPRKMSRHFESH